MLTHEFIEAQRILKDCINEVMLETLLLVNVTNQQGLDKLRLAYDSFSIIKQFVKMNYKWSDIAEKANINTFQIDDFFECLFVQLKAIDDNLRSNSSQYWAAKHQLSLYLNTYKKCVDSALFCLVSQETYKDNVFYLELQIAGAEFSFKYFVNILKALEHASSMLSIILNEDNAEIFIDKIESGSLFAKIFGNENIIKLLSELLNRVINLCHRTFTKTGKLCCKKEALAEINECVMLIEAMRANGIDTEDSKKNLSEAVGSLTMDILFIAQSGSGKTIINGYIHDIGEESSQKFLEAKKPQLLEDFDKDEE